MLYISLGSNLGNRLDNLRQTVKLLKQRYLKNVRCSIVIETQSILPDNALVDWDKPFLNMVIGGKTDLLPEQLLRGLKSIESELGRPKDYQRWSPRLIDLDILLWEGFNINSPNLKIPHAELENRPFLLHLLSLLEVEPFNRETFPSCFLKSMVLYPQFVGIVNITKDSFSDGGQFNDPDKAHQQVYELAREGASIVEIGAQSTRPGATIHSPAQEYARLKPVLESFKPLMQQNAITLSLDTFWPSVIQSVLEHHPISWINDVKGALDNQTLKLIAEKGCQFCLMHSLSIPPNRNMILPSAQRPIQLLQEWAEKNIERLIKTGFKQNNIIIDPGIGFGKSVKQNIEIFRHLEDLKKLNVQILIGHSRKSYIEAFSTLEPSKRDLETIAVSNLIKDKVDFLRVHNVEDHMRFFTAQEVMSGK